MGMDMFARFHSSFAENCAEYGEYFTSTKQKIRFHGFYEQKVISYLKTEIIDIE